ncbi:pyridoxal phosphate-dependent aminotransferase family protein [Marivirga sp. S37H4]|uniref:Pyridoxal phosphate-dependent aminotransferase family protein n=1 Tax=Marivirga aurantiaca TaxID=2802615 RepID=A0A934WZE9_9BACT|nr:pyridoxal phosphate-dependent aminotransferase family protein [Marivirga aurantiaca]MBK6266024.1 pyridoxal phosphate-dependent aminotransferase family protein [Marivirga aurantiaca]
MKFVKPGLKLNDTLEVILNERKKNGAFRFLRTPKEGMIDFISNDYLGLAKVRSISENIVEYEENGAGGSRLLSGNKAYHEQLESFLAEYFHSEAALLFNSGYTANLGVLSCVPQKGDTIYFDELSHMCIKEGVRLSRANYYNFKHNNLSNLESKMKNATGNIFVVVESVYSMDGDHAPLKELIPLCEKYNANLIVDEAHSTGLYGESGFGLCCDLEIQDKVFARIYTFGKAVGCHGAVVAGSQILKDYLVNYSRQFIYTTAMNFHSVKIIENAIQYRKKHPEVVEQLTKNILLFRQSINPGINKLESFHPIQGIMVQGNEAAIKLANHLNELGFDMRPIVSPTVPVNEERIRICLHSFNSTEEIKKLCDAINIYYS